MVDYPSLTTLALGKFVGGHSYLHTSAFSLLPFARQSRVNKAAGIAQLEMDKDFNVVKLQTDVEELSLLLYREFFDDPFPALTHSWRIATNRESVVCRTYEESRNPPILHRKELLLAPEDDRRPAFQEVTDTAEAIGLLTIAQN